MSGDDTWVSLSALQHLLFCERQATLIHVERQWRDDLATTAGRLLHERVDAPGRDHRPGVRVERALHLTSERLRLNGRADLVEYHPAPAGGGDVPFPVEVKRGSSQARLADRVQLCAQALCLEEMHGVPVPAGALFSGARHRRVLVTFDAALRRTTEEAVQRMHHLLRARHVPRVSRQPKCERCSLEPVCLPAVTGNPGRAAAHLRALLEVDESSP